jgi:hypothetical protein
MSSRSVRLPAAVVVLWLSAAAVSHAGFQDWSYTWERDPFAVPSNAGAQSGIASLKLPSLPSSGGPGASPIAPMIIVAGTTALGTSQSPADLFHNAAYTVTFTVTDDQTNVSHPFVFQGLLNGSMTTSLVHLTSSFLGGDQQSFTISGRQYTVTVGFSATDASAANFGGEITAACQVGSRPPAAGTPEPTTLVLVALALPAVGAGAWRRLKRKSALPPNAG